MQVTKDDLESFRKMGITVDDYKPKAGAYIVISSLLFWGVFTGCVLYGMLWLVAWALRALGVVVTGI